MIRITVSNRRIQVDDDKPLETVLDTNSYLNNPTVIDEYKIYSLPDVRMFDTSGSCLIYVKNTHIDKITFTTINPLSIFNIRNVTENDTVFGTLKACLHDNYRCIDERHFFNKKYDIELVNNNTNCMVTITIRSD